MENSSISVLDYITAYSFHQSSQILHGTTLSSEWNGPMPPCIGAASGPGSNIPVPARVSPTSWEKGCGLSRGAP